MGKGYMGDGAEVDEIKSSKRPRDLVWRGMRECCG
jgi:hypothetical protein